jgi:hypothetical protein
MQPGAVWRPPFRSTDARRLAVEFLVPLPPPGQEAAPASAPLLEIDTGDATIPIGVGSLPGWARAVVPIDGVDDRLAIRALAGVDLVRVTAFEPLPGVALPARDGPVRLAPDDLCPPT